MKKLVVLLLMLVGLGAGCATQPTILVNVDALSVPGAATAQEYVLLPGAEDISPDDLRFKEFCVYLERALVSKGFVPAEGLDSAEVVIFVSYAIGDPKDHIYSYSIPHYGKTGIASSHTSGTVQSFGNYGTYSGTTTYQPSYGVTGYSSHVGTYVTYTRWLSLVACDVAAYRREKKTIELWRVQAVSTGRSGDLRRVFPIMVTAVRPHLAESTDKKSITVTLKENDEEVIRIRDGEAALVGHTDYMRK